MCARVCCVCVRALCMCACCVCVRVHVFVLLPILTHVIRMFIKWTSGGAERAAYVRTVLNVRTFRVMVDLLLWYL